MLYKSVWERNSLLAITVVFLAQVLTCAISHLCLTDFIKMVSQNFMPYYQLFIPWVNRLWKVVFPKGKRWERKELTLYSQMKAVLEKARSDPEVSVE